ncbi:MAG: hypothetical protein PHZ26_00230 [Candidatus Gracilibacteria bacterium]|nr:hypothetical protein [Candidatus Gracilibacteria bacterium]MDD2908163.1 hypothetical protein [Candidatus Gracilibacteria bacterium]
MQKKERERRISKKRKEQKDSRKQKRQKCLRNCPIEMQMSQDSLEKLVILYKKHALNAKKRMDESRKLIKISSNGKKIILLLAFFVVIKMFHPIFSLFYFCILVFLILILGILEFIQISAERSKWINDGVYVDNKNQLNRYIQILNLQVNNG